MTHYMSRIQSGSDISALDLPDQKDRIIKACNGHTFSNGGLNISHLKELARNAGIDVRYQDNRAKLQQLVCNRYLADPSVVETVIKSPCNGPTSFFPELNIKYMPTFNRLLTEHIQSILDRETETYSRSPSVMVNHYKNLIKVARDAKNNDEVKRLRAEKKPYDMMVNRSEHTQYKAYYNTLLSDLKSVDQMHKIIGMVKIGSFTSWFKPYYFSDNGLIQARKLEGERASDLYKYTRQFLYCVDAVHPDPLPSTCVYRWQTMNDIQNIDKLHSNYMDLDIGSQMVFPLLFSTTWNYSWLINDFRVTGDLQPKGDVRVQAKDEPDRAVALRTLKDRYCCLMVIRIPVGQKYWAIPNDSQYEVVLAAGSAKIINRGMITDHIGRTIDVVELEYHSIINIMDRIYVYPKEANEDVDTLLNALHRNPKVRWLDGKDNGLSQESVRLIKITIMKELRNKVLLSSSSELRDFHDTIDSWVQDLITRMAH